MSFATAFLLLLVPARTGIALFYDNGAAGAIMAVTLFVLPVLYTLPRCRPWWDRHRWWLLAAQTVLTAVPFLVFGRTWVVGLSGLLGGLLLLVVRAPAGWFLFAAVIMVEGVVRIGLFGAYPANGHQYYSWVFSVPIVIALPLFGLVRLSDLVTELRAARTELAGTAVTRERLRAAARLGEAVGDRLDEVAARSSAALAALRRSPDEARARLAETAGIARQATEQIRGTIGDDPRTEETRPAPGRTVAPRLAQIVLVVQLATFALHHLVIVWDAPDGPRAKAATAAALIGIVALQLYHSLARRAGRRPRGWRVTLPLQALLPFTGYAHGSLLGLPGFPAGSALLLLTGWRAWTAYAAIASSMGVYWGLVVLGDLAAMAYLAWLSASTGLAVYGLTRLTDLAEDLQATRRELARAAAERERLRVARDTHDLLGLGLSAVALKCDLAIRLIGRDDARARREIEALARLAAQARIDIEAVTRAEYAPALRGELTSAREVLTSADVGVHARLPDAPLPEPVGAVLATVLREAVTNVLRHADATRCDIEVTTGRDGVTLRVTNDGATGEPHARQPHRPTGGHGLANLAARVAALGGELSTCAEDGRFQLVARIPLPDRQDP
jgi:two-component system sensor histidine kinase DesK